MGSRTLYIQPNPIPTPRPPLERERDSRSRELDHPSFKLASGCERSLGLANCISHTPCCSTTEPLLSGPCPPRRMAEPEYDSQFTVRRMRSNGQIKWQGHLLLYLTL